jgi:hypothetical protein
MNPGLVALTGPLIGEVIKLIAETSIGRCSSNLNLHPKFLRRLIRNLNLKPLLMS